MFKKQCTIINIETGHYPRNESIRVAWTGSLNMLHHSNDFQGGESILLHWTDGADFLHICCVQIC